MNDLIVNGIGKTEMMQGDREIICPGVVVWK